MKYVKIDEDIFWENGINELKKEFVKNEEEIFINSYGKSLEKISAMIIFQTFIEMGVKENCEYTSREFAELLNVNLEFQNLVKKWIDILIDEGMMVKTNLGVIICRRDEFEYDLYREMQECQEKERVLKLYKELKENIPATITILRNKYADVEIISNSYFSHGATQDVISSMINNKSKSMSFFYKDEIIPCKMRIGESICIDEKVGTMYLYPIISKDFRRVCKETGVKEGCFFNTFSDLSSMASFFEIGSKIYHSNSMDTFGYTEQLEKMYRNKSTENEKTIFWFGIELVNGNDVEKKLMSFEYACNWNSLSGYVCALVAEWCLNDEISKGKAYNLDEIEGIQKFIESLPGEIKQNIVKL